MNDRIHTKFMIVAASEERDWENSTKRASLLLEIFNSFKRKVTYLKQV